MKMLKFVLYTSFICATIYHLLAAIFPGFGEPSSLSVHILFITINSMMCVLLYLKPNFFYKALFVLTLQQVISHGYYGVKVWGNQSRIDWYSVIVVVGMPLLCWWAKKLKLKTSNKFNHYLQ